METRKAVKHAEKGQVESRTITVLKAVLKTHGEWFRITMLAQDVNIPYGTLHRYLQLFMIIGIVEQNESRMYRVKDDEILFFIRLGTNLAKNHKIR